MQDVLWEVSCMLQYLCEENELDQALEKIIDKEKLSNEKGSEAKKKEKEI